MHRVASRLMPDSYEGPSDRLELYERLVAANPEVVRKGATMPYTSRNGHMFSFLDPTGAMALRLNAEDRTEFLAEYQSKIAEQHGHQMKEYVVVPADLLEDTETLTAWFDRSHDWVGTLQPRPATTR